MVALAFFICYVLSLLEFLLVKSTIAFTSHLPYNRRIDSGTVVDRRSKHSSTCCCMVPLSNEEVFARAAAHKAQQELEKDAPPSLFDNALLQKMATVLSLLDTRAVQGPQSLSSEEVDQLDTYLQDILKEMRQNQHLKPQRPPSRKEIDMDQEGLVSSTITPSSSVAGYRDSDDDDSSVARSDDNHTTNTYVIPNMEQMTPSEYQEQLQKTVIEHQNMRRQNANIVTGNRATWDYMNTLGSNNAGILKKGEDDSKDGEKKNWNINRNVTKKK